MYGSLTKRQVKMAGYVPSLFFACLHETRKNYHYHYPAILTEQAWSIKDLLYGKKHQSMICGLAGQSPYPERDSSILPARVANHSARFGSSCPHKVRSKKIWFSQCIVRGGLCPSCVYGHGFLTLSRLTVPS